MVGFWLREGLDDGELVVGEVLVLGAALASADGFHETEGAALGSALGLGLRVGDSDFVTDGP